MQEIGQSRVWTKLFGKNEESLLRLKWAFFGTLFCCLAAHGFVYFNFFPRHDALNYLNEHASGWEAFLGRYVQLIWGTIRGQWLTPWMNGIMTILFMTGASFLISEVLEHKDRWVVFFSAGLMSVNMTMLMLHSSFLYVVDTYTLAALAACAGVYLLVRCSGWKSRAGAVLCLFVALGIYQSYILMAIVLLMFVVIRHALNEKDFLKKHIRQYLGWAGTFAVTAAVYFSIYMLIGLIVNIVLGVDASMIDSYNNPANLTDMKLSRVLKCIQYAYVNFAKFFFGFEKTFLMIGVANILLCVIAGLLIAIHVVRARLPLFNVLIVGVLLLLFPMVSQLMSIFSYLETIHFLTVHALFLIYPGLLSICSQLRVSSSGTKCNRIYNRAPFRLCSLILCGVVLFLGIRTSNECYTYYRIQYDATLSHVTRIMDEIDRVPDYNCSETEIVVIGELSDAMVGLEQPEVCRWMFGNAKSSATYTLPLMKMIHALGEPMNICLDDSVTQEYEKREDVQNMPGYPQTGYCQMIDDRIVLKLSPDEE